MNSQELEKERQQTTEFYKTLNDQDYEYIQQEASKFVQEHPNLTPEELYMQGWVRSVEQPLSRSIHLIGNYVQDFFPDFIQKDMKNITVSIRNIFRNHLHELNF